MKCKQQRPIYVKKEVYGELRVWNEYRLEHMSVMRQQMGLQCVVQGNENIVWFLKCYMGHVRN